MSREMERLLRDKISVPPGTVDPRRFLMLAENMEDKTHVEPWLKVSLKN